MTHLIRTTPILRRLRTVLVLLLLLPLGLWQFPTIPAQAQTPSDTPRQGLWGTNGTVYDIEQVGNTIYLAGDFTYVGPPAGGGVPLRVSDGVPVPSFPQVSGVVSTAIADGAGGWYIGGSFTQVGSAARNNLAHIRADTSVDPNWNPNASGWVQTLAVSGSTVYAGGQFTSIGGQPRNYIAALDASTGIATPWNPNASTIVGSLAVIGNTVYVGGWFTSIGGQSRSRIAALDATTGSATTWNPDASSYINTVAVSGSTVYVGGGFTSIGGQSRAHIAAIDTITGNPTIWNPGVGQYSWVQTLAVSGNTVYAGGTFTNIGGQSRNNIAALDATTGNATAWNPHADAPVNALVVSGNTIYAGGVFTTIGGQSRSGVAALDVTTGNATAWKPINMGSRTISALAMSGGTLYAGGRSFIIGEPRNHLAALDATTGVATVWNPNADGTVYTLVVSGNTIYAGGTFHTIGGVPRNYLAAINITTGSVTSWNPNANGWISTLVMSGNTLYAGGAFSSIGGQSRNRLAAFDATSGTPTAWNPNVTGSGPAGGWVNTLAVSGNTIYVGGSFTNIGGQSRNYLAALDAGTGTPIPWNPGADDSISTLVVNGGIVYAGGYFTSIGGQPRNHLAALDATTGAITSWNPNVGNQVDTLAVNGNTVYVGGDFGSIGGQPHGTLAALNATSGTLTPWNPDPRGRVFSLKVIDSMLYVGGDFDTIGGQIHQGFAAFDFASVSTTDPYEPDDSCAQASALATDGTAQPHSFHVATDHDWASFDAVANTAYVVQATSTNAAADLTLEIYDTCGTTPAFSDRTAFGRDAHVLFTATTTGRYYLHAAQQDPAGASPGGTYDLTLRAQPVSGVVLIIAGHDDNFSDQNYILTATNRAYRTFLKAGIPRANLRYLSTISDQRTDADGDGSSDVFAPATLANLRTALTGWATNLTDAQTPFYLYMMDHGLVDAFLINGSAETLTPADLTSGLAAIEADGTPVNVIYEACHSGSFIDTVGGAGTISRPGRVVITSTGRENNAYAATVIDGGAIFSNAFFTALGQSENLYTAFMRGKTAVEVTTLWQTPWLDDNGDAVPNSSEDGALARGRGLGRVGFSAERPPIIDSVPAPTMISQGLGTLRAQVRDDGGIKRVWAIVYPPTFVEPPPTSDGTIPDLGLPPVVLTDSDGNGEYIGIYENFTRTEGAYRVVVYAEDSEGNQAQPASVSVTLGARVFLPLITRSR